MQKKKKKKKSSKTKADGVSRVANLEIVEEPRDFVSLLSFTIVKVVRVTEIMALSDSLERQTSRSRWRRLARKRDERGGRGGGGEGGGGEDGNSRTAPAAEKFGDT